MIGPKTEAYSAIDPNVVGVFFGPHEAVPTTPTTFVGTPFRFTTDGGTNWT
jgi:hypothetical protein